MVYGLVLVGLISVVGYLLSVIPWFHRLGLSPLVMAIVVGMVVGNTFYKKIEEKATLGVAYSKGPLLRLGIMLYGFYLTFQQIWAIGLGSVLADAVMLGSTFLLAFFLGRMVFRIDTETTILMAAGSSVCGAAAVLATEPVVRAKGEKVAVAVSTVVVFGTIAMFLYPVMATWGIWGLDGVEYGKYIGSTVHEVAQVVAAGHSIDDAGTFGPLGEGQTVEGIAVTAKMIRVMMLAPLLLAVAWWWDKRLEARTPKGEKHKVHFPYFAVIFIVVAGFNSLHLLPEQVVEVIKMLDSALLTMAMAALGLTTHLSAIKRAGLKPLALGVVLMGWLVVVGALVQKALTCMHL